MTARTTAIWAIAMTAVPTSALSAPPDEHASNVLVVVADDLGIDKLRIYGTHPEQPATPTLDGLASQGVLFRNAWALSTCSPTRAAALTGRYPSRTGIGRAIHRPLRRELPLAEITIPEVLVHAPDSYTSAAFGKWHLSTPVSPSGLDHPLRQGFATYTGSINNLMSEGESYMQWGKVVDGTEVPWTVYATTDTTDDAIAWVSSHAEPWFVWLAYNAPHAPLHAPPAELIGRELDDDASELELFNAMVEAMDTELGRLLDGLDPDVAARTTVVFLGDNGTPGFAIAPPFDAAQGKNTLFEGGVRVPLIISGPLVHTPGSTAGAMAHVVDLLPTVADIAGVPPDALPDDLDGHSLVPWLADPEQPIVREVLFAEDFRPLGPPPWGYHQLAVRNEQFKLVITEGPDDHRDETLYELGETGEGAAISGRLDRSAKRARRLLRRSLRQIRRQTR